MNQLGNERLGTAEKPDTCEKDDENPHLSGCGAKNHRRKSTEILKSAPVWVLHVLRFDLSEDHRRAVKRGAHVDFETILPPIAGTAPYDVRAVVEHRGLHDLTSTKSGHYVAFVRAQDSCWYECDDAPDSAIAAAACSSAAVTRARDVTVSLRQAIVGLYQ